MNFLNILLLTDSTSNDDADGVDEHCWEDEASHEVQKHVSSSLGTSEWASGDSVSDPV